LHSERSEPEISKLSKMTMTMTMSTPRNSAKSKMRGASVEHRSSS
jgi:hypothetical protein